MKQHAMLAVVLVWAAACSPDAPESDAAPADEPRQEAPVQFDPSLGVDPDRMTLLPSGVMIHDVEAGQGAEAQPGATVTIAYKAWLPDGTLYEERPNAEGWGASSFVLGAGSPVPGLTDGIAGMKVGGTRRIVIPPHQGYGLVGRPGGVPEQSTLVYEVRLTKVEAQPE